jgi:DNA-binding NarL/FixJ family response regulator
MAVRTLLADDSRVIRHAVGRLLSGNPAIDLVGLASNFQEALHLVQVLKPDVIVVDLGMTAAANGEAKTLRAISDAFMIVISATTDDDSLTLARELGADVFVDKMKLSDELIPAILGRRPPEQPNPL